MIHKHKHLHSLVSVNYSSLLLYKLKISLCYVVSQSVTCSAGIGIVGIRESVLIVWEPRVTIVRKPWKNSSDVSSWTISTSLLAGFLIRSLWLLWGCEVGSTLYSFSSNNVWSGKEVQEFHESREHNSELTFSVVWEWSQLWTSIHKLMKSCQSFSR